MPKNSYRIISVGGSVIIPPEGFNVEFLKKFRELILKRVALGEKFILVVGGGSTCRKYQQAAREADKVSNDDLDWLGIYATHFNARFVGLLFNGWSEKELIANPNKKVKSKKPVLIAGGWKPGCSTDYDAVLLAKTYSVKEIINLSNIDYIYDNDPRQNPQAKKMENLSWAGLIKIVGEKWNPGANVPFDPAATKAAQKLKLTVKFIKGTDLTSLENVLQGKIYKGSLVK